MSALAVFVSPLGVSRVSFFPPLADAGSGTAGVACLTAGVVAVVCARAGVGFAVISTLLGEDVASGVVAFGVMTDFTAGAAVAVSTGFVPGVVEDASV